MDNKKTSQTLAISAFWLIVWLGITAFSAHLFGNIAGIVTFVLSGFICLFCAIGTVQHVHKGE